MSEKSIPNVLVVGGAGYIGSFTVAKLCREKRAKVVVFDDLSFGHPEAVHPEAELVIGSLADKKSLGDVFSKRRFDAVIHFAAQTSVGESVREPLRYYRQNVAHTINLLEAMADASVKAIVFSSTAATYGNPVAVLNELHPQQPVNPYGETKLTVERLLAACAAAGSLSAVALRYFNACGASEDGSMGEDHTPETHLIPLAVQAALGTAPQLTVFGEDYDTEDGTCVRDYVHVDDLAEAHLLALESMLSSGATEFRAYNIGTGKGVTVRQVLDGVGRVLGKPVPYSVGPRRAGDPPVLVADSAKLKRELGWSPRFDTLDSILRSAIAWHRSHPRGYAGPAEKIASAG